MQDVVVAIVGKENRFVFLQRSSGIWTFPSGKRKENETLGATAFREVKEETGLTIGIKKNINTIINNYISVI